MIILCRHDGLPYPWRFGGWQTAPGQIYDRWGTAKPLRFAWRGCGFWLMSMVFAQNKIALALPILWALASLVPLVRWPTPS